MKTSRNFPWAQSLLVLATLLLTADAGFAAVLEVRALIDGRSRLVITQDEIFWHHDDFVAPGRHPFVIKPTYLNGVPWLPTWPDEVDIENRYCGCDSSSIPLPIQPFTPEVELEVISARGTVEIVLFPEAREGFKTIVEFDDTPAGSAWYEIRLRDSSCQSDDFNDGTVAAEWTMTGVGNANQVSVAETGGVLELTADGATAFAGADNAGYLYRSVTGDFRAEVTIDGAGLSTGGPYRKAGLMLRESLDPWAPRALLQLAPYWNDADETHLQAVARRVQGSWGNIAIATDVVGVPRLLRLALEREGDAVSVEYSTDGGSTWIVPTGGDGGTIDLDLPSTVLLGLDVVSNDISVTGTARFDDFLLCPLP